MHDSATTNAPNLQLQCSRTVDVLDIITARIPSKASEINPEGNKKVNSQDISCEE
jgi:hypothetical protein